MTEPTDPGLVDSGPVDSGPVDSGLVDSGTRDRDTAWVHEAVRALAADAARTADTSLYRLPLPATWEVDVYVKDEARHPTGSLKHRLARSLVLYGLVNGWIGPTTTLVEASSGSTAVSEAYFARLLGLPFVAVLPPGTSPEKMRLIAEAGGRCEVVPAAQMYDEAAALAQRLGGHYLDQFTYAERATDWRGNNNVAESAFEQMRHERHPVPRWVVVGAGTGGTSATFGRYVRYRRLPTRVCVVDPERSAYFDGWAGREVAPAPGGGRIEGIGRPRVEASFVAGTVDRMIRVPDAASVAAARWLSERTPWSAGGSTGTNLIGALHLAERMRTAGEAGSILTLLCDGAERYADTLYDDGWVTRAGLDTTAWRDWIERRTTDRPG